MKRLLSLLLVVLFTLSLAACGKQESAPAQTQQSTEEQTKAVESNANEVVDATRAPEATYKSSAIITEKMAEDAALKHAGFKAEEVQRLRTTYDYDDGYEIYEVDFYKDGYEYDYDIDAVSGEILSYDKDHDD